MQKPRPLRNSRLSVSSTALVGAVLISTAVNVSLFLYLLNTRPALSTSQASLDSTDSAASTSESDEALCTTHKCSATGTHKALPRKFGHPASSTSIAALLTQGQQAAEPPGAWRPLGPVEVWAAGHASAAPALATALRSVLSEAEQSDLQALCARCLFQTLMKSVEVRGIGNSVFVATGDIPDEWIRDGSVQLALYLPRLGAYPMLRPLVEGAIRTQAYFILSDPWANSYRQTWIAPKAMSKFEAQIGRGGWVASRNFELDSGAYFMNLLWNYYHTTGLYAPEALLREPLVRDAVSVMIDTWVIEQDHEKSSPYRYAELPRDGRGPNSAYTGMVWSGFRPSDEPQTYSYNIPCNMYAAGALERMVQLNDVIWHDRDLAKRASALAADIRKGIEEHGIVTVEGSRIYAYELDGLGGVLHSSDDPNVPSLLSIPLLGYPHYDPQLYKDTRARIFSKANDQYFEGKVLTGLGSTHTPHGYVWSMAHMIQALTSDSAEERARLFRQLLKMQGSNGLMHESHNVDQPDQLTRPLFQWANTLLVTLYENSFGASCDQAAETLRLADVTRREAKRQQQPRNLGPDLAAYYERLESNIVHVP